MSRLWPTLLLLWIVLTAGGCVADRGRPDPAAAAEARAVRFLQREVPAWSRENGCFSCHNNGDAARALYEASRRGYRIRASALSGTTAWVAKPDRWEQNKGDPGFSDLRLANLQFTLSLLAAMQAGRVKDRGPLREAARKMVADQGSDGAWPIELQNSAGSPATYGAVLATSLAVRTLRQADAPETSDAIGKAEAWLGRITPDNIPAAAALLLALTQNPSETDVRRREESLSLIRRAVSRDGGWGPYADSPPEPFDTALVLLALAESRQMTDDGELIQRGRRFLLARQNPDGSWPATTRPPGGDSYAQRLSTTGWATLALLATREP